MGKSNDKARDATGEVAIPLLLVSPRQGIAIQSASLVRWQSRMAVLMAACAVTVFIVYGKLLITKDFEYLPYLLAGALPWIMVGRLIKFLARQRTLVRQHIKFLAENNLSHVSFDLRKAYTSVAWISREGLYLEEACIPWKRSTAYELRREGTRILVALTARKLRITSEAEAWAGPAILGMIVFGIVYGLILSFWIASQSGVCTASVCAVLQVSVYAAVLLIAVCRVSIRRSSRSTQSNELIGYIEDNDHLLSHLKNFFSPVPEIINDSV